MEAEREERACRERERERELRIDTLSTAWNIERRRPNTRRGEKNGETDKDKCNRFVCVYVCCFGDRWRWERRRVGDRNMKNCCSWLETNTCTHTHTHSHRVALSLDYSHVWRRWSGIWWCWKYHTAEYVSSPCTCTIPTHTYTHSHACTHTPRAPSFDLTSHWSSLLPCQIFRLHLAGLTNITMEKLFYLFNFHIKSQCQ